MILQPESHGIRQCEQSPGRHAIKAGFIYYHYQKSENAGGNNAGTFNFDASGIRPVRLHLSKPGRTFLTATLPASSKMRWTSLRHSRQSIRMYGQDEFRWKPNFTFTYGVRYSCSVTD